MLWCPRRFLYERVYGIGADEDRVNALPGSVHHDTLAYLIEELNAPAAVDRVLPKYEEQLRKYNFSIDGLRFEVIKRYQQLQAIFDDNGVKLLACEQRFDDVLDVYHGIIDLQIDKTPVPAKDGKSILEWLPGNSVQDYKVVGSNRARSQRDAEQSAQLALYAIATGYSSAGFFEIPRDLGKPMKFRVTTYDPEQIPLWKSWFKAQADFVLAAWADTIEMYCKGYAFEEIEKRWFRCSRSNFLCSPLYCHQWDRCYGTLQRCQEGAD